MSSDIIAETIDTLTELKRMYQLNLELLEQLGVACGWLLDNKIPIPNRDTICSLLVKARMLLDEIYSPPFLQHRKRTPEDSTEPFNLSFKYFNM
jgi:hypothetical protein